MASRSSRTWREIEPEELKEVGRRRIGQPDVTRPRSGLAISGGGIRSATFALGVLETLKARSLLPQFDYLSTVSGGGFIGAWLSANCQRQTNWREPSADWLPSIAHLRRYSNYLSPKVGFFSADTWSMITIWLRNTLLIQTTVILAIACVLILPRPLFELFQHWPRVGNLRWVTIFLFLLGIVGIAGNQLRLSNERVWLLRAENWPWSAICGLACGLVAWRYGVWMDFDPFVNGTVNYYAAAPIAVLLAAGAFALQPAAVWLIGRAYEPTNRPQQINFTQNWVQGVVVVPLIITAYLVAAILWGEATGAAGVPSFERLDTYGALVKQAFWVWPFPLSVVFVSFWLLSACAIQRRDAAGALTALWTPVVAAAVLHALLCAIMLLLRDWANAPGEGAWKAFVWGPPLVAFAFVVSIVALIGVMGRQSTDEAREWWSRLGAWIDIYATAWMVVALSAVYGPLLVRWAAQSHPWKAMTAAGGWIGTVVAGLFAGNSQSTNGDTSKKSTGTLVKEVLARVAPFVFIAGLLIAISWVLDKIVWLNAEMDWTAVGDATHSSHQFLIVSLVALAACAVAMLLMAARVDINQFSLNAFYRNRLVRCYLGATRFTKGERQPQNFTGFDGHDDVALVGLCGQQAHFGPLHIVNCALNLGGSSDLALHTRHSAAFTLTPLYCGSAYESRDQSGNDAELGYISTMTYGGEENAPTLGQAISVSGAAASPNMGYHTSSVTAFLLTLFNARLGWWFPNPARARTDTPSPIFNLTYLIAELFGGANDKSRFVMVSDGGHFENLAAYELIRRRCPVVVISDGECDPTLAFEGLGTLIRMCEVDFDVKIAIDVTEIHAGAKRFAVGTIDYGKNVTGTLVYLKASMTGKEDTAVRQYKASHPTFPHETTGDQFYGEDQFESYRELGREIGSDAADAIKIAFATRAAFVAQPAPGVATV
ncbi:MAG TPA: patatin-like phospholipase family protein [Vicinamibacterales bacterium]